MASFVYGIIGGVLISCGVYVGLRLVSVSLRDSSMTGKVYCLFGRFYRVEDVTESKEEGEEECPST